MTLLNEHLSWNIQLFNLKTLFESIPHEWFHGCCAINRFLEKTSSIRINIDTIKIGIELSQASKNI